MDREDVRRIASSLDDVVEDGVESYAFKRGGRIMAWPYPEKVHPNKPRVTNFDCYCVRVGDADDKMACLEGEPDVFFTTEHYDGHNSVIVRLAAVNEARLREILTDAWEAAPSKSTSANR